jgi:hypothetical protein
VLVVHACNPRTQEVEAGGYEFKARLDYIVRSCLKKKSVDDKIILLSKTEAINDLTHFHLVLLLRFSFVGF